MVAVYEYHTSAEEILPQPAAVALEVASVNVPAVFVQPAPELNAVAPAQLSLDGGGGSVTHILNPPLDVGIGLVREKTLI